jgi:hypothetical protein
MDIPSIPQGPGILPSHHRLYLQIQDACQRSLSLLDTEEVDVTRVKMCRDDLEVLLEDLQMFSQTPVPALWVMQVHNTVKFLLDRVRQMQGVLFNEYMSS